MILYERSAEGEYDVLIGEPDEVHESGRRIHKVPMGELQRNDGLDRALARVGLERCNSIPWGNDGGEVWFAEVRVATTKRKRA